MSAWAARLPAAERSALARLRCLSGLQCGLVDHALWVMGDNEDLRRETRRRIPAADHFDLLAGNLLRPAGRRVPTETLPMVDWRPVSEFVAVELPLAKLAGRRRQRIELRLVRSEVVCEPSALLTKLAIWKSYATTAPEVRLQRCQFAACADAHVLVRGSPLPPIAGARLVVEQGIAVAAGWTWSPAVEAAVLAELFALRANDVIVLHRAAAGERIEAERIGEEDWVAASRSAARATAAESDGP